MFVYYVRIYVLYVAIKECVCVNWDSLRCSSDPEQKVPEGRVPDLGRFPWLGIVQHNFYLNGKIQFAITSAVLVHPGYAVASADDISRIQPEALENNTKIIVWRNNHKKYALDVREYFLHPEYSEEVTYATLALLQLRTRGLTGAGGSDPVLPVCLPVKGGGSLTELYAIKMEEEQGELRKEVLKMESVKNQDCEEFYYKAKLDHKEMSPMAPICAVSAVQTHSCVWDAGVALVARQNWGQWALLGFGVRGPGCGAPARFIYIHRYMSWIDEVVTRLRTRVKEEDRFVVFRRVSPIKLVMYDATMRVPTDTGLCERKLKGNVLYKDNSEVLVNKNFAQGFFFLAVTNLASVRCAVVNLEVNSRTNAAVWIENHCHQDYTGEKDYFKDDRSRACFIYFKSVAFIEFRFYFSFKAIIEVTLYGIEEKQKYLPDPFPQSDSTYDWMPTYDNLLNRYYVPHYFWWWHM